MASRLYKTVKPSGGDYTTLEACMNANEKNLVTADQYFDVEIDGDWSGGPDTTQVLIHNYTTDATRYINIYTTAAARHSGVWSTSKYRLSTEAHYSYVCDNQDVDYVFITGVQFEITSGTAGGILLNGFNTTGCKTIKCIARNNGGTSPEPGYDSRGANYFINCIIWGGFIYGFHNDWDPGYYYNCTSCHNTNGFRLYYADATLTNCLGHGNTTADFTFPSSAATVTYCASSDATADDEGGAGNRINQTFTFIDHDNNDFHLASGDGGAKDYGTSLSGIFTDDIDGETRSGTWDIGADEYVVTGYFEYPLTVAVSVAAVVAIQNYLASLQSTASSSASVADFKNHIENVSVDISSVAGVEDAQGFIDNLLSQLVSESSVIDYKTFLEYLSSIASSAGSIADIQVFIETLSVTVASEATTIVTQAYRDEIQSIAQGVSSIDDYAGYFEPLLSIGQAQANIADIQGYLDQVLTIAQSISTIDDVLGEGFVENLTSIAISSSSIQEIRGMVEGLVSIAQSQGSVVDRQHFVDTVVSIIQAQASAADAQGYLEALVSVAQAAASVEDAIFVGEVLLSTAVSSASVEDKRGIVESLVSTMQSASSVEDKQLFVETLSTLVQAQVSLEDLQHYIHVVQTTITSGAKVVDTMLVAVEILRPGIRNITQTFGFENTTTIYRFA